MCVFIRIHICEYICVNIYEYIYTYIHIYRMREIERRVCERVCLLGKIRASKAREQALQLMRQRRYELRDHLLNLLHPPLPPRPLLHTCIP